MTDDTPRNGSDLDGYTPYDLAELDIGDEVWIPASPIRGNDNRFRAMKVKVLDKASVGEYEEKHAIHDKEKWEDYVVEEQEE